ncbi:MAG: hypothetical protein H0T18_01320 [Chloroflexia bacterium]|nr:hypothetical protein [Chloroflexia bacterium]
MESRPVAIRRHLIDYLAGTISLDELKERVIDATWDVQDAAPSDELQLAYDVQLVLVEESSGFLTRDELRTDLQELVDRAALHAHT